MSVDSRFARGLLLFSAFIGIVACASTQTGRDLALVPLQVQLRWSHQAQFAGFYAAAQEGYYENEGLSVSFVEGGPQITSVTSVLEDVVQFGVADAAMLLLARARGEPVRAIGVVYRRSPIVFFAQAGSGITAPQDFVGKTIGLGRQGLPVLHAMTSQVGVSPAQYTTVIGHNLAAFYEGQVDVVGGYIINEALQACQAGYELNLIFPDNYGVHFYADTIFTTDRLIASNPELVTRFLRATLKGWTYVIEHPEAVGPLVQAYAPEVDASHQFAMLSASLPLINTGEDHIGWMEPEVWAGMEATLRQDNALTAPLDATQAYTMQFLHEIYGD